MIVWLALGDSFTIGTGVGTDRAFPAVVVRRWAARGIECELVNPSVNGYATDDLIREELPLARAIGPTLVTLLIGANDVVRGSDERRYRAQLGRIHDGLLSAGVAPAAICALPQPDWSLSPAGFGFGDIAAIAGTIERFNEIAHQEAGRADALWIDLFPLMREQARRKLFAPDGLHPSAEAYAEWARELATSAWASSP